MSNKLIGLNQLQEFKTQSDAKYQDKLTAGSNITISNNVISASITSPTYVVVKDSGSVSVSTNSIRNIGSVTLQPGMYFLVYTCMFTTTGTGYGGYVQCGFSTNTTDITGFGRGWGDNRKKLSGSPAQTCVSGIIRCTAATTFYMLAKHNASAMYCEPRCYYIKFS